MLPPVGSLADLRCRIFKRHKYVTLQFEERDGSPRATFTLHHVEASKLAQLILKASAAETIPSDLVQDFSFAEGVHLGGSPLYASLVESRAQTQEPSQLSPAGSDSGWQIWRQDDNGNRFMISSGHRRAEAERIAAEFEARGHKQMYWVSPEKGGLG